MTTHKNTLFASRRYWERQIDRLISGELVSKTPKDILLNAINTKLEHIDDDLFRLSLS